MKKCCICGQEKELVCFSRNIYSIDNLKQYCKDCAREKNKKYREKNKDKIKTYRDLISDTEKNYQKIYRIKNKENIKTNKEAYRIKNKEKIKSKNKEYYEKNKEKILLKNKKYKKENDQQNKIIKNIWYKKKRCEELFKLRTNISTLIRNSIKNTGYKKNTKVCTILCCSIEELLIHLNNNEYGFKYNKDFDIDHIIPISEAKTEDEILKLNHYTNLQLLPKEYNRNIKKCNKWDSKDFENWYKTKEEKSTIINNEKIEEFNK